MDMERLYQFLNKKYLSKREVAANLPLGMDYEEIWQNLLSKRKEKATPLPFGYWYTLTDKMIASSEKIVEELIDNDSNNPIKTISNIEETYFTGFVEGAQISIQDAMSFLQSGREPQDIEELLILNNRKAGTFAAENYPIDENYLHHLVAILTNGMDLGRGNYRTEDFAEIPFMKQESFSVPTAHQIPIMMQELIGFINDDSVHPLIKSAVTQSMIMIIRPFPEGNERLARLLSGIILNRAGYVFYSNISLSALIARSSYKYFNTLANILRVENAGDFTYFIEFYLELLANGVEELHKRKERSKEMPKVTPPPAEATPPAKVEPSKTEPDKIAIQKGLEKIHNEVSTAFIKFLNMGLDIVNIDNIIDETKLTKSIIVAQMRPLINEGLVRRSTSLGKKYYFFPFLYDIFNRTPNDANYLKAKTEKILKSLDDDIANKLLEYIKRKKYTFESQDVAKDLNIKPKSAYNGLRFFVDEGFMTSIGIRGKGTTYTFCFATTIAQEVTTSELYDLFGDQCFSAEMVVAKLNYDENQVSATLNDFTMMKILDHQDNGYKFIVNPNDNPEFFKKTA